MWLLVVLALALHYFDGDPDPDMAQNDAVPSPGRQNGEALATAPTTFPGKKG
jgi:hypothetical protein